MAKITSNALTVIDQTDSRKFEVHISSNLPQVQIYDQNKKTYSPDWSNTALNLQASIYLDSTDITTNASVTIEWYKNSISTATKLSNGKNLTINTNALTDEPIVTYICQAKYQNLTTSARIDYTRIDSGINGSNGTSAPAVQAQYSVDGSTAWTATLNAATHKYVKYSYDGGKTWTTAIKMKGEDGTSVKIVGTAYTPDNLTVGETVKLYSDSNHSNAISTNGLSAGDSYLVGGYLCVYNADNNSFVCTGTIQGPAGNDGQSSYVFIRYATDANGTGISTSPSGKTYIGVYTSNTNTQPAASAYTWSKFVGDSAKNITLSANSQVFKMNGGNATPETIAVTGRATNTSITTWEYSVNGKDFYQLPTGSTTISGVSRIDNTTVNITGSTLSSNSLILRASDGTYNDVFTVYKAFDGSNGNPGSPGAPASMAFLTNENVTFSANASGQITETAITTNVVAYSGTTKITPTIGTISGLPTGMTATIETAANNEISIVFTIANNSTLGSASNCNGSVTIPVNSPVATNLILNWSKVNSGVKGDEGVGIKSVTVTYGTSTAASTQPTTWYSTIPTVAEGSYLWTRTITDYTDDAIADTVTLTYAKQGAKGDTGSPGTPVTVSSIKYQAGQSSISPPTGTWEDSVVAVAEGNYLWTKTIFSDGKIAYGVAKQGVSGRGVSKITEYYLATSASSGVTIATNGWTETVQTIDNTKKYLWNYETITYTDNTTNTTTPLIIGAFGSTGKGIKTITEYYLATASSSNVTTSTSGWTTTMQTLTSTNKYLWNYELITYTDNATATINPVIIGVYGDQGVAAVSFQVYAPNGYLLRKDLESLDLQTFACEGSTPITSGAKYQWEQLINNVWTTISDATSETYTVTQDDVLKAKSYRCIMEYKEETYISTVTVQDATDIYESVMYVSSNVTNNEYYWVLYTLVYTEAGEVDPLLGPVTINAPLEPVNGDYWYSVDTVNMSVKLKKYDGTSWVDSTDTQSLSYSWDIINDGSAKIPLSGSAKVKVVSSHNFTATATVVCEVSSLEDGLLTHSSLSLIDASDPIVSNTEPKATVNGQIWIKSNNNGTYLMFIWDEANQKWVPSDMDTRNKVYTSKPSSYNAGDLWITASDSEYGGYYALAKTYSPNITYYTLTNNSYVVASPQPTTEDQVLATQYYHYVTYLQGTLLQAQFPNTTYEASDWAPTLKYDKSFDDIKETLDELKQYVDITGEGLRITAKDSQGNLSPFSSLFTSDALTFYQGTNKLLTLANNQLTAPKIVVENDLEVARSISLGDLKIIIEDNGSFSFAVEK